jgi:uncharacterized membrane protein YeiB
MRCGSAARTRDNVPATRRPAAVPVRESERLTGLDVVGGVAVLGILVINVQLFAMPYVASSNPYAVGQPPASDLLVWSIAHVLAEQKFITIFSLIFGAGVVLMTSRAAAGGASAARLHYRRMAWLLVFGLGHAYLLWHGDILVLYAVCGSALLARLSAVGRMALSCYILETLISTFVFYGHGLGLFGTVDRLQQMLFTAGAWVVLLIAAPLWLARFPYGPLEWLWRSLTYGRVESMQRVWA